MADDPRRDEAVPSSAETFAAGAAAAPGRGRAGGPGEAPQRPGPWWAPSVRVLRFLLGAVTLVGGLTWILVNLTGPDPLLDLIVGLVLSAGALVLLMPHRIRLPRRATTIAVLGAGLAGTVGGLFAETEQTCCAYRYLTNRGWPFHWVERGAVAGDPDTAFRLAQDADWQLNLLSMSADALLWAYAGLLLVVVAVLVRRARSDHDEPLGE
jgi:hypothetical protein